MVSLSICATQAVGFRQRALPSNGAQRRLPVALTTAAQGSRHACVTIAIKKGAFVSRGGSIDDRMNSDLVQQGLDLHQEHFDPKQVLHPDQAALLVPGVQHLAEALPALLVPEGGLPASAAEFCEAAQGAYSAPKPAAAVQQLLEKGAASGKPFFLTITNRAHTTLMLVVMGGGRGGPFGCGVQHLIWGNDIGNMLLQKGSDPGSMGGYYVRLDSPGDLEAAFQSLLLDRYGQAVYTDDDSHLLEVRVDAFTVDPGTPVCVTVC